MIKQIKQLATARNMALAIGLAFAGIAQAATETINIGPNNENMSFSTFTETALSANGAIAVFSGQINGVSSLDTPAWARDRQKQSTQLLSKTLGGQSAGITQIGGMSADGRYVTFSSNNASLVSGDTNNAYDIFVVDRTTGLISRANVANDGTQAALNSYSNVSTISADGRYVVFNSSARNLQTQIADNGAAYNVFVRDLVARTTKRINITSSNGNGTPIGDQTLPQKQTYPLISSDGRFVAFYSPQVLATNGAGYYIRDQLANTTTTLPIKPHPNAYWALSSNGRYISYYNQTTYDVEAYDRQSNTIEKIATGTKISLPSGLLARTSISASGRYVTYVMNNTTPAHAEVYDRDTKKSVNLATYGATGTGAVISGDGRHILVDNKAIPNPLFADDGFCSIYNPYISQ